MFNQIQRNNNTSRPANGSGVWAGSSGETYFIFASDLETQETIQLLEGHNIGYQPLRGAYVMQETGEQVIEDSFIVNTRDIQEIENLAMLDKQESILYLTEGDFHAQGRRRAYLMFNDSPVTEDLGHLTPVSEEVAMTHDNWSLHINSNQYFITTEEGE